MNSLAGCSGVVSVRGSGPPTFGGKRTGLHLTETFAYPRVPIRLEHPIGGTGVERLYGAVGWFAGGRGYVAGGRSS
jgi:hypothetical protein